MKTLIIDCDGVLYPESLLPISKMALAIKKQANSIGIKEEEYKLTSKETKKRGEEGLFNFVLNLCHKNMNSYNNFCKEVCNILDYSKIKRDDELYELLIKTGKKYEICILTNNCKDHLDKVYSRLFGKTVEEFPFPSYDVSFTFKNEIFHPKQSVDGFTNFIKKINKKNSECIVIDDSQRNIQRCIENNIPYELISYNNTLKMVLNKLNE